ncbi:MAG: fimbria/pilus outer membrane usher protein [Hyphomonas sp.]
MKRRNAFLFITAAWITSAQAAADTASDDAQTLELTFPVSINGRLTGNITADIGLRSEPRVDADQLFSLLTKSIDQSALAEISSRLPSGKRIAVAELREAGLNITYNPQALRLDIIATEDQTLRQVLSLTGARKPDPSDYYGQQKYASGLTASLLAEYRHDAVFGDDGLQPIEGALQGFVNVGGFEGFTLDYDLRLADTGKVTRNGVVLSKDDYERGIRYAAGDIDPLVTGFQSTPGLGGISVSRQFGTIQPFRDVRPSGQQGLYLERDAIVDVVIDGVAVRTLNLSAGRYELRDFPFIDASADVQFFVDDGTGRRQVASLSLFGADSLLEPGLSVFSATLGFLSKTPGSSETYDGEMAFTGFYERGINRNLTVGVNLQGTAKEATLGLKTAIASRLGRFSFDLAGSSSQVASDQMSGYAFSADYRGLFTLPSNSTATIELVANQYSEHFSTLGDDMDVQPREWDAAARASFQLPAASSLTFGARASKGRGAVPDEQQYDVSLSKLFGRVNTFTSVGYDAVARDVTARIGISLRWGDRSAVRSSYNSRNETFLLEAERLPRLQVGDLSARLGYERRRDLDFISADGLYRGNRGEAAVRHTYAISEGSSAPATQVTTARLSTGLGVTPQGWAFGRRADEGFAIVRAHRSLRGRTIDLGTGYARGAVARVDRMGAVAVPLLQPYIPQAMKVEVRDLPPGYDIGAGQFDVFPGAGAGYNFTIGSDAAYTVVGTLVTQGADLYLSTGTLTSLKSGEAQSFFTNRNGRFVVERVAPGVYELRVNGIEGSTRVTVNESEEAYVDLGNITFP